MLISAEQKVTQLYRNRLFFIFFSFVVHQRKMIRVPWSTYFFFLFGPALSMACTISQARDQTCITAVTMPDPWSTEPPGKSLEHLFFFSFFGGVGGPHHWHMEVPMLGIVLELQLPAYTTAILDLSHICDLCHSSWQCRILNPLIGARDPACILMDTSWVHYCWATKGTPEHLFLITVVPYF